MLTLITEPSSVTPPVRCRLRLLRGRMTQKALAERVGVDAATIGRWERGRDEIPDEYVSMLAELFGVSAVFLMGWPDAGEDMTPEDRAAEKALLLEAAEIMGNWAARLPRRSEWRWALVSSRRYMLHSAGAET